MSAMATLSPEQIDEPLISNISFIKAVGRPSSPPDFPSSPTPPRVLGSRHSMYATGRRPLRSSPLAGPALRVDEPIEEVDEEKNQQTHLPRPSRVLSTPNLATLLTPPPHLRHARPKTAEAAQERFSQVSILSPPAKPSKCSSSLFAKRRNSEMVLPLQPQLSPSPSPFPPSRSMSPPSLRYRPNGKNGNLRGVNNEKEPLTPPPAAVLQRHQSTHGSPINIRESHLDKEFIIAPARSRDPKDNSWLTANTYAVTPKFSRLGLAASGVVLPVSAKDHKRLSRHSSRSSVNMASVPSTGGLPSMDSTSSLSQSSSPTPSTPTPDINDTNDLQLPSSAVTTPTLTRSSASSLCSDDSSIIPSDILPTNSNPVIVPSTDSATTIQTIVERDESVGSYLGSKGRDKPEPPQTPKFASIISSPKNKLKRFKMLKHRTTKSFDSTCHTTINQQPKEDYRESDVKNKGCHGGGNARRTKEIRLGFEMFSWSSSSEASSSDSLGEDDLKRGRVFSMRKSSSMKSLWKSISLKW